MNIVVLAGGQSNEKEVSILSGKEIWHALKKLGHNAILLDVSKDIVDVVSFEKKENFIKNDQKHSNMFFGKGVLSACKKSDLVFIALHGGDGENGKLQACFDLLGINYTGNDFKCCCISMDKWITKKLLCNNGVLVPKGMKLLQFDKKKIDNFMCSINFPCILKTIDSGSSLDIYLINNMSELYSYSKQMLAEKKHIMIEEFVKGREISVGIIGDKVLPIIEICGTNSFFNYTDKYESKLISEICPAENINNYLYSYIHNTSKKIQNILGVKVYCRIDFIINDKGVYCLEVNSLPGMTQKSLLPKECIAENISFEELCQQIIDLSMKNKYRNGEIL